MTNPRPAPNSLYRGVTLIETLLYIGLFGALITGVLLTVYPLLTGADRLNERVTEEGEAAFVLHKIAAALSAEEIVSIDIPDPDLLIINRAGGDTISIRQGATSNSIELSDGGTFIPLTASRAEFTNFSASYTASTGGNMPHTVTVSFSVGGENYSRTYHVYFN